MAIRSSCINYLYKTNYILGTILGIEYIKLLAFLELTLQQMVLSPANSAVTIITALQNFQDVFEDFISSAQEVNRLLSAVPSDLILVLQNNGCSAIITPLL